MSVRWAAVNPQTTGAPGPWPSHHDARPWRPVVAAPFVAGYSQREYIVCIVRGVAFGDVLLGILAEGPAHGYDLKREHDERFPASRSVAYGQVYSALSRLEQQGLVEVVEVRQEGGPERTVYALTDGGEAALRTWMKTTEEPGSYAADELVRKTVTALLTGQDAPEFLSRQREVHVAALRQLTADLRDAKTVGSEIAIDHARAHLDAELRWLDDARERVRRARVESDGHAEAGAS